MSFAPFGCTNLNPLYEVLEILKVEDIYTLKVEKFAYKQNKYMPPIEIANYFGNHFIENNVRRSSRLNTNSRIVPTSSSGLKSVQQKVIHVWNEIPGEIKSALHFNAFKKMSKPHLNLLYILYITSRCATAPAPVGAQVTPTGFLFSP